MANRPGASRGNAFGVLRRRHPGGLWKDQTWNVFRHDATLGTWDARRQKWDVRQVGALFCRCQWGPEWGYYRIYRILGCDIGFRWALIQAFWLRIYHDTSIVRLVNQQTFRCKRLVCGDPQEDPRLNIRLSSWATARPPESNMQPFEPCCLKGLLLTWPIFLCCFPRRLRVNMQASLPLPAWFRSLTCLPFAYKKTCSRGLFKGSTILPAITLSIVLVHHRKPQLE